MIDGTRPLFTSIPATRALNQAPVGGAAPSLPVAAAGTPTVWQAKPVISAAPEVAHPYSGKLWDSVMSIVGWVRGKFLKAAPPVTDPTGGSGGTYTVQSGDSLSRIAGKTLGDSGRWQEIYNLNRDQISNPNVIYAGQVLKLPGGSSAPAPAPAAPATVTVQSGDTLFKIARNTLGNGDRWQEIYDANRDVLSNPNLIYPGMTLKIPGGTSGPAPAPAPSAPVTPGNVDLPLSADQIAAAIGAPAANVRQYWPMISSALAQAGITDRQSVIAALATIAVETGSFKPIPEYASGQAYEGRSDLGNTHAGDGVRYKGRGFIQITGRANYSHYGQVLGVNLEGNPDLALDPTIAARVLAEYFKARGIPAKARAGDWQGVRRAVNGGLNGYDRFYGAVTALQRAAG